MGKFNEIQEQTTQSWGSNSFTTTIKDNTVEFDSAKDKFTFTDPVEVPSISVNGQESVAFTSEDRIKLDNLQTPMQIKGRVDSVAELPTEAEIGDTYLVGLSGSETFEEYVCVGVDGSDETAVWESVGTTQVQSDWNQNDNTKADYIKNRICYENKENLFGEYLYFDTTTGNLTSQDGQSGVFYFNPTSPFINGETYKLKVGETEVDAVFSGDPTNTQGGCSLSGDNWSIGLSYNTSGIYGAPHNETAMASGGGNPMIVGGKNVELIATKIVKIDDKFLVQSDWDQNDNTKADYIKNRICYDASMTFCDLSYDTAQAYNFQFDTTEELIAGETYTVEVTINGTDSTYTRTAVEESGYGIAVQTTSGNVNYSSTSSFSGHNAQWIGMPGITKLKVYQSDIKTIDDKFIPDTIARTSQLGGVQFKIAGSPATLQASIDGGSTWQTVTLS